MEANDPVLSSSSIIISGVIVYIIAYIYPPLIILVAYLISQILPYLFHANNDDATARRKYWKTFAEGPCVPEEWKDIPNRVKLKEEYWINARGMCLMTSIMTPKTGRCKAVAFYCHGYGDNPSFLTRLEFQRFVKMGIAVVMIEYEGHGRSDGLFSFVPSWENLIDDVSSFYEGVMEKKFYGLKYFLVGQSMGGAVCYYTYNKNPSLWSGVIFFSPMCKVADEMKPPEFVVDFFKKLAGDIGTSSFLGKLPITPTKDVSKYSYKLTSKRDMVMNSPTAFSRRPRLATARELLNVTTVISNECKEFDAPFLIVHGLDDKVTSPKQSQLFYDQAKSTDKEIKLYKGMWHNMITGEPEENIDLVFSDVISWIMARI